jgi:glutathione S-transferase
MSGDRAKYTLLAFAPMIDSELSRLVLAHYGVAYRERDHLFVQASLLTWLQGGFGQIPMLYGQGLCLSGPRAMVDHFETGAKVRLIPRDQPARRQVEADWVRYNGEMATDTAAIAYFYLLPQRAAMMRAFSRNISALETRLLPACYGSLKGLFTLLLSLNQGHIDDALRRVRVRFGLTDKRLADGRAYLGGDRLTLADLSLISAVAPLLLPEGFDAPMPSFDEMPAALQAIVSELRQTRTAKLVQRFYSERSRSVSR